MPFRGCKFCKQELLYTVYDWSTVSICIALATLVLLTFSIRLCVMAPCENLDYLHFSKLRELLKSRSAISTSKY